ncbi:hypothetical protein NBRC3293_0292 [Gluconobacter oxydans NBRC 3293]|uniref:Uncharacterized protein n=1 Tax=Gluconobacter oxydans NBRC 3293 TaxID=1315969 RepID=A0A829WKM7_GLUOY|nr:hypothetical protein NBRC3293_0292 [Gluconobacter oxydans NBRC 3293]
MRLLALSRCQSVFYGTLRPLRDGTTGRIPWISRSWRKLSLSYPD